MIRRISGFFVALAGGFFVTVQFYWTTGEARELPHLSPHLTSTLVFFLGLTGLTLICIGAWMMVKPVPSRGKGEGDTNAGGEHTHDRS